MFEHRVKLRSSQHLRFPLLLQFLLLLLHHQFPLLEKLLILLGFQLPNDLNSACSGDADEHVAGLFHRQEHVRRVLNLNRSDFVQMLQRDFAGDFSLRIHRTALDSGRLLQQKCGWRLMDDELVRPIGIHRNLKKIFLYSLLRIFKNQPDKAAEFPPWCPLSARWNPCRTQRCWCPVDPAGDRAADQLKCEKFALTK